MLFKKLMKGICITLVLSTVFLNDYVKAQNFEFTILPESNFNCKFLEEQFTGLLFLYVQEAIKNYYGENRGFMNAKLLELKKTGQGMTFEATVQVKTFVGPHNPPYGLETITIKKDLGRIYITKFKHEDIN
jgi:hypothetical protein